MQNDATTAITRADMLKILDLAGHKPEIIDFANMVAPATNNKEEEKKQPKQ